MNSPSRNQNVFSSSSSQESSESGEGGSHEELGNGQNVESEVTVLFDTRSRVVNEDQIEILQTSQTQTANKNKRKRAIPHRNTQDTKGTCQPNSEIGGNKNVAQPGCSKSIQDKGQHQTADTTGRRRFQYLKKSGLSHPQKEKKTSKEQTPSAIVDNVTDLFAASGSKEYPSLYSWEFVQKVWKIPGETSARIEVEESVESREKIRSLIHKFLHGIDVSVTLEQLLGFLNLEPHKFIGYQVVMIIISDFLRKIELKIAYQLCEAAQIIKVPQPYKNLVIEVVALKAYHIFLSDITKYCLNEPCPALVNYRIKCSDGAVSKDYKNDGALDFLKSSIKVQIESVSQVGAQAAAVQSRSHVHNHFYNAIVISLIEKFFSHNYDLFMDVALIERKFGSNTQDYLIVQHDMFRGTLSIHPEILAQKFNLATPENLAELRIVSASLNEKELLLRMLYAPKSWSFNPDEVTGAIVQMTSILQIPNLLCFLYGSTAELEEQTVEDRPNFLAALLKSRNENDENLIHILKDFENWLPIYLQLELIKKLSAEDMLFLLGNSHLICSSLKKFMLATKWAYIKCNLIWDEESNGSFIPAVRTEFQKVKGVINFLELFPHMDFIITQRVVDQSEFYSDELVA